MMKIIIYKYLYQANIEQFGYKNNIIIEVDDLKNVIDQMLSVGLQVQIRKPNSPEYDYLVLVDNGNFKQR